MACKVVSLCQHITLGVHTDFSQNHLHCIRSSWLQLSCLLCNQLRAQLLVGSLHGGQHFARSQEQHRKAARIALDTSAHAGAEYHNFMRLSSVKVCNASRVCMAYTYCMYAWHACKCSMYYMYALHVSLHCYMAALSHHMSSCETILCWNKSGRLDTAALSGFAHCTAFCTHL